MLDTDIKTFVERLKFTNGKYDTRQIFSDLITLAVYFINATMLNNKKYASEFDNVMRKYTIQEQQEMWSMLIELYELYGKQREPIDIMTEIFSDIGLGNKTTGQFFTPTHISEMMTEIVVSNNEIEKDIEKNGYITLHEPTCGAGGMILAYAKELKNKGYDTYRNLYVIAWDIDILCTYMTYLQLSMYDIPAVVVNGNTLSLKEKHTFYTPAYYVFEHLKKAGKLNVPTCSYCKEIINGEVYNSKLQPNAKLCTQCYSSEKRILLLKEFSKTH